MQRYASIDVLRTVAIFMMVLCHSIIYLSSATSGYPWIHFFGNHFVGDFAAPFFTFLVGMSQGLSLQHRRSLQQAEQEISKYQIIRGLVIFFSGLLFSALAWGLEDIFSWDVLTLIGGAIVLLAVLRNRPAYQILGLCLAIFIISPWLRTSLNYLAEWGGALVPVAGLENALGTFLVENTEEYSASLTLSALLKGFLLTGFFPILPWIIFPLVGFVIGRNIWGSAMFPWQGFLALGLSFCILAVVGALSPFSDISEAAVGGYIAPLAFYPATTTMVIFQMGLCLLIFTAFSLLYDRTSQTSHKSESRWLKMAQRLSRYSLTIYVFHHFLLLWPLWLLERLHGEEYYQKTVNPLAGLGIGIALLFILNQVTLWLDRRNGTYSLEILQSRIVAWLIGSPLPVHQTVEQGKQHS